ncbi:hypothetical protein [Nocardia salmonicida]|uniref:hypothetical protein n=1 Tax=Nocardia salmonicida TaxID=53431 RepID=UPI002E29ECB6|nr:hypothetical protein [Nocardia salmonicida]
MTTAADHYDQLLAEHYTWMSGGDIDATAAAQADLLRRLGLQVAGDSPSVAVDLGCGICDSLDQCDKLIALVEHHAEFFDRGGAPVWGVPGEMNTVVPGSTRRGRASRKSAWTVRMAWPSPWRLAWSRSSFRSAALVSDGGHRRVAESEQAQSLRSGESRT